MAAVRPVCGIRCPSCSEFLFPPMTDLGCGHTLHQKCLDAMAMFKTRSDASSSAFSFCPGCATVITHCSDNVDLWPIIIKMNRLVSSVLSTDSNLEIHEIRARAFRLAIEGGDEEMVLYMLKEDGFCPKTLLDGLTPVYVACLNGQAEIARFLLRKGASIIQQNDLSYREVSNKNWHLTDQDRDDHLASPIKAAIISGRQEIVDLVLGYNFVAIEQADHEGRTPLFYAIKYGHAHLALFFINYGVKVDVVDNGGISILRMAVRMQLMQVVVELVKRGCDVCEDTIRGGTLLYEAATKDLNLSRFLLEKGARKVINHRWLGVWTPLSKAVEEGKMQHILLLLEFGADLTLKYNGEALLEFSEKAFQETIASLQDQPVDDDWKKELEKRKEVIEFIREKTEKKNESMTGKNEGGQKPLKRKLLLQNEM